MNEWREQRFCDVPRCAELQRASGGGATSERRAVCGWRGGSGRGATRAIRHDECGPGFLPDDALPTSTCGGVYRARVNGRWYYGPRLECAGNSAVWGAVSPNLMILYAASLGRVPNFAIMSHDKLIY